MSWNLGPEAASWYQASTSAGAKSNHLDNVKCQSCDEAEGMQLKQEQAPSPQRPFMCGSPDF